MIIIKIGYKNIKKQKNKNFYISLILPILRRIDIMFTPKELCGGEEKKINVNKVLESHQDLVTSAPQKLYRYLGDLIREMNFQIKGDRSAEPKITSLAIGETGEVNGYISAETAPMEIQQPYKILRIIGVIFVLISFVFLAFVPRGRDLSDIVLYLLLFIIFLIIGIELIMAHKFVSYSLQAWIKGEAYKASAIRERGIDVGKGGVSRVGIISELRVILQMTRIYSKNKGMCRIILNNELPQEIKQNFDSMLNTFKTKILPRIELPTTIDEVRSEAQAQREKIISEYSLTKLDEEDKTIEEKLLKLKKLYDKGLINEEEYNLKRKELLEKL